MTISDRHRAYWRRTRLLTAALLVLWFAVTFVAGYFAADLNAYSFLGFPLGFYIFAQGGILVFVTLVVIQVVVMDRLDRRYRVNERR